MMPKTATVQSTRKAPQVPQPNNPQQQITQINRKLYPNVLPT
jgi:hypothetical protein